MGSIIFNSDLAFAAPRGSLVLNPVALNGVYFCSVDTAVVLVKYIKHIKDVTITWYTKLLTAALLGTTV